MRKFHAQGLIRIIVLNVAITEGIGVMVGFAARPHFLGIAVTEGISVVVGFPWNILGSRVMDGWCVLMGWICVLRTRLLAGLGIYAWWILAS